MNEPWLHGKIFGGTGTSDWYGQFALRNGVWFFSFLDEQDQPTELYGAGGTPKEAFERLVFSWTFRNGGVESDNLRSLLPDLRSYFREDGDIDPQFYMNIGATVDQMP